MYFIQVPKTSMMDFGTWMKYTQDEWESKQDIPNPHGKVVYSSVKGKYEGYIRYKGNKGKGNENGKGKGNGMDDGKGTVEGKGIEGKGKVIDGKGNVKGIEDQVNNAGVTTNEVADGTAHDEASRRWLSEGGHTPLDSPVAWAATRPAVGKGIDDIKGKVDDVECKGKGKGIHEAAAA